jgi:hydroxypyruvate reductase
MKPEILLLKVFYEPAMAELEREFIVRKLWTLPGGVAAIGEVCANVRAVVSTTTTAVGRSLYDVLPKLEIHCCYGPYTTLIDLAAAKERNIIITSTPDSTAEPVADLAMGMIVAVMRRLCEADRFVRSGQWPARLFPSATEGRIGREIARRAEGFGMKIAWFGPRRKDDVAYRYVENLEQLARESDCLVVTCALTPETHHLIDARILNALGVDGFLVNIARGAVVDEDALVTALTNQQIAGAALDVFRDEPNVPAALLRMDNVVLAPHMGTSTREVREERSRKLLLDIRAHFAGEPLTYRAQY